jgi:hypothetical protein
VSSCNTLLSPRHPSSNIPACCLLRAGNSRAKGRNFHQNRRLSFQHRARSIQYAPAQCGALLPVQWRVLRIRSLSLKQLSPGNCTTMCMKHEICHLGLQSYLRAGVFTSLQTRCSRPRLRLAILRASTPAEVNRILTRYAFSFLARRGVNNMMPTAIYTPGPVDASQLVALVTSGSN